MVRSEASEPQRPPKDSQKWLSFFVFMHCVYILYSPSLNRYYVGETAFLSGRLDQHNSGFYKNASTKSASDWELFLEIECVDRSQALKIERFIKQQKSRKFIERMKSEPKIIEDILLRFS
ncbi:putative endonuclease [Roseivirga ehrenbergii]|nr:putative endonuclease [Roseivirga ehrenbergii]